MLEQKTNNCIVALLKKKYKFAPHYNSPLEMICF